MRPGGLGEGGQQVHWAAFLLHEHEPHARVVAQDGRDRGQVRERAVDGDVHHHLDVGHAPQQAQDHRQVLRLLCLLAPHQVHVEARVPAG